MLTLGSLLIIKDQFARILLAVITLLVLYEFYYSIKDKLCSLLGFNKSLFVEVSISFLSNTWPLGPMGPLN